MEMTPEQVEAFGWALDMAYDDQQSYMSIGNPHKDYGDDWPDSARQKAAYCRSIAEVAPINGEDERWTDLAEQFEASAHEYEEQQAVIEAVRDPKFVEALAKNIKFFLERGHDTEPEAGR